MAAQNKWRRIEALQRLKEFVAAYREAWQLMQSLEDAAKHRSTTFGTPHLIHPHKVPRMPIAREPQSDAYFALADFGVDPRDDEVTRVTFSSRVDPTGPGMAKAPHTRVLDHKCLDSMMFLEADRTPSSRHDPC